MLLQTQRFDLAGIDDPRLRAAYERCRLLHARHGRTYYLATALLPPAKRPHVHALYGFARYADEIVDNPAPGADPAAQLASFADRVLTELARGVPTDDVTRALFHTMTVWNIPVPHVAGFLRSMSMDLTITEYATYDDLRAYMWGSAAVIGLQMLPLLEPLCAEAADRAMALGEAFQLTNFVRDVAEDLCRGRLYLPTEELTAFGVTREELTRGVTSAGFIELIRSQIHRIRELYRFAEEGIDMLAPSSRPCIRTAAALYGGILDEVEAAGYRVLDRRVSVPLGRRLRIAVPEYWAARRLWAGARGTGALS